jgi:hypothetical protein
VDHFNIRSVANLAGSGRKDMDPWKFCTENTWEVFCLMFLVRTVISVGVVVVVAKIDRTVHFLGGDIPNVYQPTELPSKSALEEILTF